MIGLQRSRISRVMVVLLIAALALSAGLVARPATVVLGDGGEEHDGAQHSTEPGNDRPGAPDNARLAANAGGPGEVELYTSMRTLWNQHMEWTWAVVVAFATDSPAFDASVARLLGNQEDIGNAVAPFYGGAAADQLTALLTTHIQQAVPVLQAAKAGDKAALEAANSDWFANAQEIADFLAAANPNWPREVVGDMMEHHITTTLEYAGAALGGDWEGAIASYDEAEAHMLEMADVLSAGIIAQFPDTFQPRSVPGPPETGTGLGENGASDWPLGGSGAALAIVVASILVAARYRRRGHA